MTPGAPGVDEKRETFRRLHESGCFVIPNPWDLGSARYLASLGFQALATTSAGFAWSRGRPDNGVTLDDPAGVAANVRRAVATGIAGLSIEDSTGDDTAPLFEFDLAVARVRAAAAAVAGSGVTLVARSEGFVAGRPDLAETVRRLSAYAEAGADCLYAPGLRAREEIAAVVRAVAPKPVNVLVGSNFTTVAEVASLGVRRISVGGALARTAWGGFARAAVELARAGTFGGFSLALPSAELEKLFKRG
jgi:2-methylisocitrate lyase-like PEP mutase family enzyme